MDYLEEKNCSIEDLNVYISQMAHIDDNIIQVTIYCTLVLICLITLRYFKYRKGFFITAEVVYLIATTSVFSNGLTDYLISNIVALIAKLNKESFSYVDMEMMNTYFVNALKEALLTVVIFDTIFEIKNSIAEIKYQKDIRFIFASMDIQIDYLEKDIESEFEFVGRMNIPSYNLEKMCRKEIDKLDRSLKHQKVKNKYYYKCKNMRDINFELAELLVFLKMNSDEKCTCDTYISDETNQGVDDRSRIFQGLICT